MGKYFLMRILLSASGLENSAISTLLPHCSAVDVCVCSGPMQELGMTQKCLENRLFLVKRLFL